jgi:RND family efflux transporter MFP subunit
MLGAEARMKYLQARRGRADTLYQTKSAVSEENRDEATSAAIAAEQDYQEAKATYALAVAGPRAEQIAQGRAQVRMQQALVDKLADQIKKHTISSRFDGYVSAKQTELGQWLTKGDVVVEVVALDPVEVRAYVPEIDIPHVSVGTEVHVEVPALPQRVFTGRVALIIPEADSRARTFPVKVRVDNPSLDDGPSLKAGMYARVTLPTGPVQKAMLVPKDALVLGGPRPVVFVVDTESKDAADGKVRPVPVELGIPSGGWIQIKGPLTTGQRVVVRGNERLRPGQGVTVTGELPPEPKVVAATRDAALPRN